MLFKETLAVILLWGIFPTESKESRGHVSVVLLGATGDLAKKYLWQSLFQLYVDEVSNGHTFTFYGAAQKDPDVGRKLMFGPLKSLACSPEVAPDRCAVLKDQFLKLTEYHQLKGEEDYASLNRGIKTSLAQEELVETGRIFYLSVPPFAYAEIARHINSSCRPPSGAWLRVVLEKPFGHDLLSAQQLAEELAAVFREEEIYRVDHYLGKQVGRFLTGFELSTATSGPGVGSTYLCYRFATGARGRLLRMRRLFLMTSRRVGGASRRFYCRFARTGPNREQPHLDGREEGSWFDWQGTQRLCCHFLSGVTLAEISRGVGSSVPIIPNQRTL